MGARRGWIAICCIVAAVSGHAQSTEPGKLAWQWTEGERLAERTNDESASSRVRLHTEISGRGRTLKADSESIPSSEKVPFDVIDGARHPELFFPFELFDHLMFMAYSGDAATRAVYRESKKNQLDESGLPADFWERLETIGSSYRAVREEERALAQKGADPNQRRLARQSVRQSLCRERALAIAESQAVLGDAFQRFLYDAVAPQMISIVYERPNSEMLSSSNRGC